MYKRIEKRVRDTDYERDMQEVLEVMNDNREKYLQSIGKMDKESDNASESKPSRYREVEIKTHFCSLCKQQFPSTEVALHTHLNSDNHIRKVDEFKLKYRRHVIVMRKIIFKGSKLNNSHANKLRKLKFLRVVYEFK